jgi:hypothetical protein
VKLFTHLPVVADAVLVASELVESHEPAGMEFRSFGVSEFRSFGGRRRDGS